MTPVLMTALSAGVALAPLMFDAQAPGKEILHPVVAVDDLAPSPDCAFESRQDRLLLLNALEQVPLLRRAVLVMHDIDEIPMAEIAVTLSMHRFTGYSRLRKARKELAAAVASLFRAAKP